MKNRLHFQIGIAIVYIMVSTHLAVAQPNLSTKRVFEKTTVYQDFKNKSLYYFAPNRLSLGKETNGKPKFSLLSMRYTGTQASGNSGEKRFTNLVQFTIQLDNPSAEVLKNIKNRLGANIIQLRPLPIRYIENNLVAFFEEKPKEIGKNAGLVDETTRDQESFWTERVLNYRLDNADAQLLIEQIEKKQSALSFSYAFMADCISGIDGTVSLKGNKSAVSEALSAEMVKDTLIKTQSIFSDVLQLDLNYPDLIKKIDLNEELPPVYALLEARCYDFEDNLRPDLFMKTLEIQAVGVNGRPVILPAKRFMKNKTDVSSIQIQFPFAIRMYEPLKYKITEYFIDGKRSEGLWISKNSFSDLIDISTPLDSNTFKKQIFEFEIGWEGVSADSIEEVKVDFIHYLKDIEKHDLLIFEYNDLRVNNLSLVFDKNKNVNYSVSLKYKTQMLKILNKKTIPENYTFINLKKLIDSNKLLP